MSRPEGSNPSHSASFLGQMHTGADSRPATIGGRQVTADASGCRKARFSMPVGDRTAG